MADNSSIEWTDASWNPVRGCTRVSPGCQLCYAEGMAARFSGPGQWGENFAEMKSGKPRWTGQVALLDMRLEEPIRWMRPRRIFVNSTSDLFHERLSDTDIDRVFAVAALVPRHTLQILTKRHERMLQYMSSPQRRETIIGRAWEMLGHLPKYKHEGILERPFPLPNVWLGVSVENQPYADERIPHLLDTPAAVRFVSYEPALGPVDYSKFLWPICWHWDAKFKTLEEALAAGAYAEKKPQALVSADRTFLDWIIVGGESGRGARPFALEWARSTVRQCKAAGVPVFVKQLGANPASMRVDAAKGNNMEEWPEDLRIREFPK